MDEFEIIERYFRRDGEGVAVGIGDDGAIVALPAGRELVVVVDTLVEGVHFPADMAPQDVGYRSLAINLSDIAAMGAVPAWMTLSLTLTEADPSWLEGFAEGLFGLADRHAVALIGGDTTRGPLTVSVAVLGHIETGARLLRSGARLGHGIFVSGTLGDAAGGLRVADESGGRRSGLLWRRFLRPEPRLELGRALLGVASAAIDISDGLVADLGHICSASGVGARIDVERLPLSAELIAAVGRVAALELALSGGDDYELCFTLPPGASPVAESIVEIGTIEEGDSVRLLEAGRERLPAAAGYRHFGDSG